MTAPIPGTFGPAGAEQAWGEPTTPPTQGGSVTSGKIDVGHGHTLKFNTDAVNALLQGPLMQAGITKRAQQVVDEANANVITEGAQYETVMSTNADGQPTASVQPANYQAVIDEQAHSTLLAASTTISADPKLEL